MFRGIDVLKLVCALLVVYTHTYCYESGWGFIRHLFSALGVPFFFIASGFFFAKGLKRNDKAPQQYVKKYVRRVSVMYLLWTVLSLPVAWMNLSIAHAEYAWWMKCIYLVRCLFLTGSVGIYWYVLSLIYNSLIIYCADKYKWMRCLSLCSIILFAIGVAYNSGIINGSLLYDIIHVSFGSERNFLNVGLLYMCAGYYFANHSFSGLLSNRYLWLALLLVVLCYEYFAASAFSSVIFQLPASICLFLFGIHWCPRIRDSLSLQLRKWSTIIYLSHFPFILVFDYYLKRGTLIDFSCAIVFSVGLYYVFRWILPEKVVKRLYG